ncbi:MAG: hypothetical protein AB2809_19995 [Candidatus Thiodiazotropha sp.]
MKSLLSIVLVGVLFLQGCAKTPLRTNIDNRSVYPLVINVQAIIDKDREGGYATITNNADVDVFCPSLRMRVIYDDPNTYLERGEQVLVMSGLFFRPGEVKEYSAVKTLPGDTLPHVRSIHVDDQVESCRSATIEDYCASASLSDREEAFLLELHKKYRTGDCGGLVEKMSKVAYIDLTKNTIVEARPLIYLKHLRRIDLLETEENREIMNEYEDGSRSTFLPNINYLKKSVLPVWLRPSEGDSQLDGVY